MLDKFEQNIIHLKRKINSKYVAIIFFLIFGLMTVFEMDMANNFKRQKDLVQDEYNRTMYELVSYIQNIQMQLSKVQIVTTDNLIITTLSDIWRQSNLAKENLANLPILQDNLGNTSKFLSQVSDYSYYLINQKTKGIGINEKEYEQINNFYESSNKLVDITTKIFDRLNEGSLKWDEVEKLVNKNLDEYVAIADISDISKEFQDYAGLIYDGAFSDHILDIKPKSLPETEISIEDCKNKLNQIFNNIENIEYSSENNNLVELYEFNVKFKDKVEKTINITKKGGFIYSILSDKKVEEQKLNIDVLEKIGLDFFEKLGIENMTKTYYIITDNLITINYAPIQENVLLYPDLIKIKIAMDNGEILSYESMGYTFNHVKRDNVIPKYNLEECKKVINKNLQIIQTTLCIIPTDSKKELLCYEFKTKLNDQEYSIYVNTLTKLEEKVLMIIKSPEGTITM